MTARRLAAIVAAACALNLPVIVQAQVPSTAVRDVARQLAIRIARSVAPLEEIALAPVSPDSHNATLDRLVQPELVAQLRAQRLSLVPSSSDRAAGVRVTCSRNLRDLVCAADVIKGDIRDIVVVSTRADAQAPAARLVTLTIQPVVSRHDRILDLLEIGDRLLVLTSSAVHRYDRAESGWRWTASQPIAWQSPPPRDARGRLSLAGDNLDAYLPGMTCRVTIEPLRVSCMPSTAPWPTDIPESTMATGTNYFASSKTPPFYAAARVGVEAPKGWLLDGLDGRLRLLGDDLVERQSLPEIGDDLATLKNACAGDGAIVAASAADDGALDAVRAYEFRDNRLAELTPPVPLPGRVTALWEIAGKALVVVLDRTSGDYDAFYVALACAR